MVSNFYEDLRKAKGAEQIVLEKLSSLLEDYTFEDVSNDSEYYHKEDIRAVDAEGAEIFIEVKDDSRIYQTSNVLCEESVYYYDSGYCKGNMYSDYDIYCIVSQ